MLARSPSSVGALLIAAISGRALAAAARRAGYRPLVADFFRDIDTVALAERTARLPGSLQCGIDGERVVATLRELAGDEPPVAVVLGSGFERKAGLVDEIARHLPLAGSRGAAIRRVKDLQALAEDCQALGIPHPAFALHLPPDPENWVEKTAGAAGGAHVRRACDANRDSGRYYQRLLSGDSISALFVGDGRRARVVGFSRQWVSPTRATPFRYGGAVRLRRVPRRDSELVEGWLSGLTERSGLVGLCGADFIRNRDGWHLLEINPRPGATLDIFDSPEAPLMEAHLRSSRGEACELPRFTESMASMIAYASWPILDFPVLDWPDWTADRQSPGSALAAGDPVCTILASGPSAAVTRRIVKAQARRLQSELEGGRS